MLQERWRERFFVINNSDKLGDPFLSLAPRPDRWLPILVLNGTSVETGRRILTSHLAPNLEGGGRLFKDAYDLHELLNDEKGRKHEPFWSWQKERCACQRDDGVSISCDVTAASAVMMSARFPIVSPHGSLRNRSCQLVDRVVDGGYFENYGAVTALEIAEAITQIDAVLRPFVIQISDEAEANASVCGNASSGASQPASATSRPHHNLAPEIAVLATPRSIIRTVLRARAARGSHATTVLAENVSRQAGENSYVHFTVCRQERSRLDDARDTEFRDLSMSWWLSMPVQQYLDAQICNDNNKRAGAQVLDVLRGQGAGKGEGGVSLPTFCP